MKLSIKKGFGFGLTSGVITTIGLMVGLNSSTHSSFVVMGGIIVIAIADALSDSLGIHISEESTNKHTPKEIWESTIATFFSKFIFALTFIIPLLLFPLSTAVIVNIFWGMFLISIFSFYIAKKEKIKPYKVVTEHLLIAVLVVIVTYYVGEMIASLR